jgi:hypothetical protein
MVIVYADFPNEPEHQLALAKYTASKGFNCVEAEMDKLDVCRKVGLKVRLGSIDINKLLQAAPKLKDESPQPIRLSRFRSGRTRVRGSRSPSSDVVHQPGGIQSIPRIRRHGEADGARLLSLPLVAQE